MHYFDTSFLTPLFLPEATSESIDAFLNDLPIENRAISHWTRVEFASVIARHIRMGNLDADAARKASVKFRIMIDGYFAILLPDRQDFDRAKDYIEYFETKLRAGDALHLAIAKNRGADAIYSLDKSFIAAGKLLGLPTTAGIDLPFYGD